MHVPMFKIVIRAHMTKRFLYSGKVSKNFGESSYSDRECLIKNFSEVNSLTLRCAVLSDMGRTFDNPITFNLALLLWGDRIENILSSTRAFVGPSSYIMSLDKKSFCFIKGAFTESLIKDNKNLRHSVVFMKIKCNFIEN